MAQTLTATPPAPLEYYPHTGCFTYSAKTSSTPMPATETPFESPPFDPEDVQTAHDLIRNSIEQTPVITSTSLSKLASQATSTQTSLISPTMDLYLKCENQQKTGSFKYRGAMYSIKCLRDDQLRRGLVTTSSGNHGKALATVTSALSSEKNFQIPTTVIMPRNSLPIKTAAARAAGATVQLSGPSWPSRMAAVETVRRSTGATVISTSTDPEILLGQGTVALEFAAQVRGMCAGKELDAVVVPCGSGGLLAGVATALRGTSTRVFGAEPKAGGADDAVKGRKTGKRVEVVESESVADGLRCPVGLLPWEIIKRRDCVKGIFAVGEKEIRTAMRVVFQETGLVVEPSAAVPIAVVLYHEGFRKVVESAGRRWTVGVVLSGGNVDPRVAEDVFG